MYGASTQLKTVASICPGLFGTHHINDTWQLIINTTAAIDHHAVYHSKQPESSLKRSFATKRHR
jgi:hypothetical protein